MTRMPGQEHLRRLAMEMHSIKQHVQDLQRGSQASFRSVMLGDGPVQYYDPDGNLVGQIGVGGPGQGLRLASVSDEPPPQPTVPDCKASTNLVSVTWDGTFVGANRPSDLDHVEIHRSLASGFTPDDLTQCGEFHSRWGGVAVFPANLSDGAWYYRLVAVDLAGNRSVPSMQDSAIATANTWG